MKTIGGIGYILSLIPLVSIVAPVLVGIAWLQMGGMTRTRVFKATGVLMIIQFVAALAFLITFPLLILSSLSFSLPSLLPESFSEAMMMELLENIWTLVILGIVAGAIAITAFILEMLSHFRAARIFNVRWFRYAAWLRIISIIAFIAFGGVIALSVGLSMERTARAETTTIPLEAPLLGWVVAMIIPTLIGIIFSAVAFFKIPETA